uniref:Uncharacterized protein n=1 Tax=Knipowitschia caucasica TaxID=637954 RepID=A0AAV2LM90_KNICA
MPSVRCAACASGVQRRRTYPRIYSQWWEKGVCGEGETVWVTLERCFGDTQWRERDTAGRKRGALQQRES